MLKRGVGPASAGGRGLILIALVGFISGPLGVFGGRSVKFSLVYAEAQETGRWEDKEMGRQGDWETWGQGERE